MIPFKFKHKKLAFYLAANSYLKLGPVKGGGFSSFSVRLCLTGENLMSCLGEKTGGIIDEHFLMSRLAEGLNITCAIF